MHTVRVSKFLLKLHHLSLLKERDYREIQSLTFLFVKVIQTVLTEINKSEHLACLTVSVMEKLFRNTKNTSKDSLEFWVI